nr:hypothetical protein Iba_chr13dCG11600 [Ipomoea batatas]
MAEELGQKNGGGADIYPRGGGVVRLAQGAGWRSPGPLTFPTLTRNVRFSSTSSRLSSPCFASMSSPSGVNRVSNKPPPNLLSHLQIRNPKDICNTEPGLQRIPNPCHRAEPKDCFPKP